MGKPQLTPQQRAAIERARQDRPKPKPRAKHWHDKATAFAREHRLEVNRVEDEHDHRADLLEWNGVPRAEAEWRAWHEVVELLGRRAA